MRSIGVCESNKQDTANDICLPPQNFIMWCILCEELHIAHHNKIGLSSQFLLLKQQIGTNVTIVSVYEIKHERINGFHCLSELFIHQILQ